jgi:hypothetical protein
VQPAQRSRRPPRERAQAPHQRRHEQRAHDARVDRHGERGAHAELLDEEHVRGGEGADRHAEEQRRGGDEAPGALEPVRHRLAGGETVLARLFDAREQEHAVVGRQGEGDDEQQHQVRLLKAADRAEAEQPGAVAVLEDEHEQRGADGDREQVHRQRHQRQDQRAGHHEQEARRDEREDRDRERRVRADRGLLVDERCGRAPHQEVRRRRQATQALDQALVRGRGFAAVRQQFKHPHPAPEQAGGAHARLSGGLARG